MIEGSALKYEADDVNTDVIWPGKYTYVQVPEAEMPRYAMETFDPDFARKAAQHAILVVGKNFGGGSSREQASGCLKASGIRAVIAKSFARIFFRNSINLGLPAVEAPEAVEAIEAGAQVRVDLEGGAVHVGERVFPFPPYPPLVLEILQDGGLIENIKKRAT